MLIILTAAPKQKCQKKRVFYDLFDQLKKPKTKLPTLFSFRISLFR